MHGVVHIGILRACERLGFKPDLITGTSAGAIVGGLWAAGTSTDTLIEMADELGWWQIASLPGSLQGLASNERLATLIQHWTKHRRVEQMTIPFGAVATDVATGRRVVLTSGDLGTVVAASSCVPVVFEPVLINGVRLVDGGLTEPVPVKTARELGATHVIGVDVQYRPYEAPVGGLVSIGFQSMQILVAALTAEQLDEADLSIRLDVHELMGEKPYVKSLVPMGEAAFRKKWVAIKSWRQ